MQPRAVFQEEGFLHFRGVLDRALQRDLRARVDGLRPHDVAPWTLPDGVCRSPSLWPLISDPRILRIARIALDAAPRFVQHNDVHFEYSAGAWHRDGPNREWGRGPDFEDPHYKVVRIGIYLLEPQQPQTFFGVVRGSHRRQPRPVLRSADWLLRAPLCRRLLGLRRRPLSRHKDTTWLTIRSGDVVAFDPRVLHHASRPPRGKRAIFLTYGDEAAAAYRHWSYYRFRRPDLAYSDLPPELRRELRERDLLPLGAPSPGPIPFEHVTTRARVPGRARA